MAWTTLAENDALEAKLIINKFLHIYLREEIDKADIINKIEVKVGKYLSKEEIKKQIPEWEQFKTDYLKNKNTFDTTTIDSLSQQLFAKENA